MFLNADKFVIERVQSVVVVDGGCPRDNSTRKLASDGFDVIMSTALGLSNPSTTVSTAQSIFKTAVPLMAQSRDALLLLGFSMQTAAHGKNIMMEAAEVSKALPTCFLP
jgi:hypothetical protein